MGGNMSPYETDGRSLKCLLDFEIASTIFLLMWSRLAYLLDSDYDRREKKNVNFIFKIFLIVLFR